MINLKKLHLAIFHLGFIAISAFAVPFGNENGARIRGKSVDELVLKGIKHIDKHGKNFKAKAGSGKQAYDVSYTLLNPQDRLHSIRSEKSIKYFCRELLAYFKGSLNVNDGLAQASSVWKTLADKDGNIASNYGYYVFHQKVPATDKTQYEWVIANLTKNLDSRKAFININQPSHKSMDTKDFPCTIGMQFFIRQNQLCCSVSSRSTDVYTGLPYDIGFFSFVTELVYKDLKERLPEDLGKNLRLGTVTMKTNFTQIYDKTANSALELSNKFENQDIKQYSMGMPVIENAQETLKDIMQGTQNTSVMKWIYEHAQ